MNLEPPFCPSSLSCFVKMHSSSACWSETKSVLLKSGVLAEVCYLCLRSVVRFLHSYHPGQSGCEEFAALLPRYPFQIQPGVAAVTPLVALKDCNQ